MLRYVVLTLAFAVLPIAVDAATINWTFYGPGAAGNMQGSLTAARNSPEGNNRIRTLDDVRTKASRYITLASASTMSGRWYCLGTVTYTSPQTRQTHTLQNVVGYVHDTGCAFNGTCSCTWMPQYCSGQTRVDKMDIPVGNFAGWGAGPTAQFIIGNTNQAPRDWQELAGLPQEGAIGGACGGTPQESAPPVAARYSPTNLADMAPGPLAGGPFANNPYAMQQFLQPGNSPYGITQQQLAQIANPQNNSYAIPLPPQLNPVATISQYASKLLVQPRNTIVGRPVLISWTSVNMRSNSCEVYFDDELLASGAEGTKRIPLVAGTHTVDLECVDLAGDLKDSSETIVVQ